MIASATLIIVMATIIFFGGGTVPLLRCLNMIREDGEKEVEEEEGSLLKVRCAMLCIVCVRCRGAFWSAWFCAVCAVFARFGRFLRGLDRLLCES